MVGGGELKGSGADGKGEIHLEIKIYTNFSLKP
jgi:hypothetical protein